LTDPGAWARDIEPGVGTTFTGKRVNARTALQTSAVYFCTSLIADAISSLPVDCYRTVKGKSKPAAVPSWLARPNPRMTPQDFWHRVITSMVLEGNGYIYVARLNGVIDSLWPVHPSIVDVNLIDGVPVYTLNGVPVGDDELIHIPAFTLAGEPKGLSVLEAARQAVGMGLTTEEFGARFFGQGTTMAGVIEVPGKLEPTEAKRLKADFAKNNSGTRNSHAIGVLTGGATWQSITVTPEQAQFLATRAYTKTDIALFFKVPPYMVDPSITSTWGTGIEEQNWAFIQNTLQPWITRIEQAISLFLLYGNQQMRFNLNARLRAKTLERMDAYAKGIEHGVYCLDDVRALEDLDPLPDGLGQKFFVPANLVEVGKEPPKPEPAPPPPAAPDPNAAPDEGNVK
jgi:HK97 family phage portal protein